MNNIKAIFFDIGGVLAKEDREKQYSTLCKIMNMPLDDFQRIRKKKVAQFSSGKISEKEYLNHFVKTFGVNYSKLKSNWIRLAKENYKVDKAVQKTILRLKKHYILGTLTNIIPLHHKIRRKDNIYRHFKVRLLSFEQGFRKPDGRFYKLILKRTGLRPPEIIFIDDHKPYLEPAKKLGIKTVLFKDNKSLVKELRKAGVKV